MKPTLQTLMPYQTHYPYVQLWYNEHYQTLTR